MSGAAELAGRTAFRLGGTTVDPAARRVEGPGGSAMIEPRVMQLLVALADARGAVVGRESLGLLCWGGRIVGDDALNRAVGVLRRVGRREGAGGFGVETIPRVGYRLTGAAPEPAGPPATPPGIASPGTAPPAPAPLAAVSRRGLLAGAALGLGGLAAIGAWRLPPDPDAAAVAALVDQGAQAMRQGLPEGDAQGVGFLSEAVRIDPGHARAWGKLALAHEAALDHARPADAASAAHAAEQAARRALALDPAQGDALAALARLPPTFGDWLAAERRLRGVLAVDPANVAALSALGGLLAGVGRNRAAAAVGARVVDIEPLSPAHQYRRAYGWWNAGRPDEAERVLDRAAELWPRHPALWNTRLVLLAFTGRPAAATAMIDDAAARPPGLPADHADRLRLATRALGTRTPRDVAAAVARWRADAPLGPAAAVNAVMFLSELGALDDAFDAARGYLLRRGPLAVRLERTPDQPSINDQRGRKTMMLFLRPLVRLRGDARFLPLCRALGLFDYWRAAGAGPDFLGGQVP